MSSSPPPSPFPRRRWLLAALVASLALAAGIGIWIAWHGREAPPTPPILDLAGSDPEVIRVLERARDEVSTAPRSGPAWGRLGQLLRGHGFAAEANRCLEQAERFDPAEPRWPYLRGLTLVQTDPAAGIPCLERAAARCGAEPLAPRLRLAEVLLEQGRLDEGERQLRQAQRRSPHDPRVLLGLGRLALARGDWSAASEYFAGCGEDEHARKRAATLRADALYRLGQQDRARDELARAARLPDDEPWPDPFVLEVEQMRVGVDVELARAGELLHQGRPEDALAVLEELVRARPDCGVAWLRLGQIHLGREAARPAEAALEQAVRCSPDSVEGWFQLGCARFLQGRTDVAADSFRRTLRLKPDHTLAHFNLGHCLKQQGERAAAAEEFRAALRCQPDYAPARAALEALRQSKEAPNNEK